MFKHWREADKRAVEIKAEIEALNVQIEASRSDISDRDLDVEKREALLGELKSMVDTQTRLKAEYDKIVENREELRARENDQISLEKAISTQRVVERYEAASGHLYSSKRYELAWANYIRSGNEAEVRQLISTVDSGTGKIVVPTTLVNRIESRLRTGGRLVRLCRVENIKGLTEHPVSVSTTDPNWHDETGTQKGEKTITIASIEIDPQFVAETLATTKKFEADSIEAFWGWLFTELPDALLRKIDREILYGLATGVNGIRGILTNANSLFVVHVTGVLMDFNIANIGVSALDDGTEDNTTVVMNRRTFFDNIRGLRGDDGHPIWTSSSNEEKPKFFLGGFPVVFNSSLPAYDDADEGDVFMVVGDFNAMLLNFPEGMSPKLIRDELTRKKENVVEYLSEIYVGGNITRPGCFAVLEKGEIIVGDGLSSEIEVLKSQLEDAQAEIYAFKEAAVKAEKESKKLKADEKKEVK